MNIEDKMIDRCHGYGETEWVFLGWNTHHHYPDTYQGWELIPRDQADWYSMVVPRPIYDAAMELQTRVDLHLGGCWSVIYSDEYNGTDYVCNQFLAKILHHYWVFYPIWEEEIGKKYEVIQK